MSNPNHLNQLAKGAGSFLDEFKAFALKGNIIDLAVAVAIGAAFGKVVTSVVDSFINPLIALVIPHVDNLAEAKYEVMGTNSADEEVVKASFTYGAFLAEFIAFVAVALVLFLIIKKVLGAIHNLRAEEAVETEAEPTAPSAEEKLLTEIRDLLANR